MIRATIPRMRRTKSQGAIPSLIVACVTAALVPYAISGFHGWLRGAMSGLLIGSSTFAFQLFYSAAFLSRYGPQRALLVSLAMLCACIALIALNWAIPRAPLIAIIVVLIAFALHLRFAYGVGQIFPDIVDSPQSTEAGAT